MDNRRGEFEFLSSEEFKDLSNELQDNTFKVGEVLEIKQSRFKVQKIFKNRMQLKLLPAK